MKLGVVTVLCALFLASQVAAQPVSVALSADRSLIYVSGSPVHFEKLRSARDQLLVPTGDRGLSALLSTIGARMQYQPGTRFVLFTRADGKLVTFTVGSNAVTIDDSSQAIPIAPFFSGGNLYVPLLALAQALGLGVHPFAGGYALAPQIVSVTRRIGQHRTIVEVAGTGPLTWHASYASNPKKPSLSVTFPGFFNQAGSEVKLGGREAGSVSIRQGGPPGYPITTLTINSLRGVRFAAHRLANWAMELVLARDEKQLAIGAGALLAPSVSLSASPPPLPASTKAPLPTQPPAPQPSPSVQPQPSSVQSSVPTAAPAPEATENGSPPGGSASTSPSPSVSSSPSSPALQKITNVAETDAPGVSRITLTVTGPVSFAWHRLAAPDNRFWVDISQAELVGPAQTVAVALPTIRSVTVSQNELTPDHVVRIAIDPTQPVEVEIGAISGASNQLGIDVHANPPPPGAPISGVGALVGSPPPQVSAPSYVPTDPRLIVIDPGHGGNDPGAINESMGLTEKVLTLEIAKRLREDLRHKGWRVAMTRDGDYEVGDPGGDDKQELQARCDLANAAGARLFISVHINSSVSSDPNGVTTYYWQKDARPFAQAVEDSLVDATRVQDDGIIRNNFYVIHHTKMPGVLVEVAYLSNYHDAELLSQAWFLDRVADAIAAGVQTYTGGAPK
jgi:N-acetylmuramoyl-L-alanine amidase